MARCVCGAYFTTDLRILSNPSLVFGVALLGRSAFRGSVDNFYANVYVSDDKLIFHESIPGVPSSPLALGAPITFVTHRVSSLKPIAMKYQLSTEHMKIAGCKDIGVSEISDMGMAVAMEEAVPSWRKQVCAGNSLKFALRFLRT